MATVNYSITIFYRKPFCLTVYETVVLPLDYLPKDSKVGFEPTIQQSCGLRNAS
jgi:hypothetical protein